MCDALKIVLSFVVKKYFFLLSGTFKQLIEKLKLKFEILRDHLNTKKQFIEEVQF